MFKSIPTAAEAFDIWVNSKAEDIHNSVFIAAEKSILSNLSELVLPEHLLEAEEQNTAYGAMCEENGFKNGYNYAVTMLLNAFICNMSAKENSFTGNHEGIAANENLIERLHSHS